MSGDANYFSYRRCRLPTQVGIAWPPPRNGPCWCGSGAKHKKCCGRVTVTVHGRPWAVLVSVEDLERLEETLSILGDPSTLRRLAETNAELARGEVVSAEDLAETMRRRKSSV